MILEKTIKLNLCILKYDIASLSPFDVSMKVMTNEIQDEIIEEFTLFDNKNDTYTYIIELGKKLPDFPAEYQQDANLIKGCQSKVWIKPKFKDGKIIFLADSDSVLVKGLVSLVLRILSGKSPDQIIEADLYFIDTIGLRQMLSMNRSNGLLAMIKQLKMYAIAYHTKESI